MSDEDKINQKPSKWLISGVVLLAIFVIGTYAAIYIPAYVGTPPEPSSLFVSIFWSSLFFVFLWKLLNLKKIYGFIIGVLIGSIIPISAAFMAGFTIPAIAEVSRQFSPETEWVQAEFNEQYMNSINKKQCMYKTVSFLKECDSDNCLKTMAGVSGDCVTYAIGSNGEFCKSYDANFINAYCLSNKLSYRACKVIEIVKNTYCKQVLLGNYLCACDALSTYLAPVIGALYITRIIPEERLWM